MNSAEQHGSTTPPSAEPSPGTPDWLRILNAEGVLRGTLLDLAAAKREIALLKHAVLFVEHALVADPTADDFMRSLVKVLQAARGVK